MKNKILNIIKDLEKFDENWNYNIYKLESLIDHVHPDIMNLLENFNKEINFFILMLLL